MGDSHDLEGRRGEGGAERGEEGRREKRMGKGERKEGEREEEERGTSRKVTKPFVNRYTWTGKHHLLVV